MDAREVFDNFPNGPLVLATPAKSIDSIVYRDPQGTAQFITNAKLGTDGKTITPADGWPAAHSDPYIRVYVTREVNDALASD